MEIRKHVLDWTYAFTCRLQSTSPESSLFAGRLEACAQRLQGELQAGTLPYLNMPFRQALEADLPPVLERIRSYKHMMLLGIGGSALGARALQKAFFPAQDRPGHTGPFLWIADNIDADTLDAWMGILDPKETVVVVISKSGGTIETMAQYFLVRRWLQKSLGEAWKAHVVLVTDEKSGDLRLEATAQGLLSLPVPDHLGGRYSVLSAVGLLPAAFLGMDWKGLLRGAAAQAAPLLEGPLASSSLGRHPAWRLAVWSRELMECGYDELIFFSYIPLWNYFGAWFSQLWAESLGKGGKGSMPVPAVGVTDQHSVNQMFLDGPRNKGCLFLTCDSLNKGELFGQDIPAKWSYLAGKRFGDLLLAEGLGTRMALTTNHVPLVNISMGSADEEAAGRLMGLCMTTTILTGWLLDINPIDQPAVELGKRLANSRLGASGHQEEHSALEAFLAKEGKGGALQEF
ncbi:MAG: glucose-6-phosphate isomerase [Desulfovibrio sp.]|jgi:glucose-6-phosphate isomerase|nr:glucose-6-phosphate isomerase [Desulfovibrio sp.]